MKTCKKCDVTKELTEFYFNASMVGNREGTCKVCRRDKIRKRYQNDAKHRKTHNMRCAARQNARYHEDDAYRLVTLLRCRTRAALDGKAKAGKTIEMLGCTPEFLRGHLESQFTDGMAWGQRGKWSIDHRIPVAAFDLTDHKHQRYCFHWSNLQPLWTEQNLRKSDKYRPDELEAYLKSDLPEPL